MQTETINPGEIGKRKISQFIPDWPLVIWLVFAALILGFVNRLEAPQLVQVFNAGWGRALGEFALILLPSFILASVLSRKDVGEASTLVSMASPIAGAGMICPDTAYAALSPVAGRHRLIVAFGSYSGFKLLFPAGPLIVATGLGVSTTSLLLYGLVFLFPVWGIGVWWANFVSNKSNQQNPDKAATGNGNQVLVSLLPFVLLAALLLIGGFVDFSASPLLDFFTEPKGALILAAVWALLNISSGRRRECLDEAVRRSASLLFVIGAASAFGALLTLSIPVSDFVPTQSALLTIVGLFTLTAMFKLAQGSSMATFAAVAPVAAPIVAASNLPPSAAVFAICLGSFVAILPNDSFYWLVRKDALAKELESKSIKLLAGGAVLQAFCGLALLLVFTALGLMT